MPRFSLQLVAVLFLTTAFFQTLDAQVSFPLGSDGTIEFAADSSLTVSFSDGTRWGDTTEPGFLFRTKADDVPSVSVRKIASDRIDVGFQNGTAAIFRTTVGNGFVLFRLEKVELDVNVVEFEMGRIALPLDLRVDSMLGRASDEKHFIALSTAALQVRPVSSRSGAASSDRAGCSHTFTQTEGRTLNSQAAKFTATCNEQGGGWSYRGVGFPQPKDLTGLKAIRAVVHGDGLGQLLKIQPIDNTGAARDTYIPINFTGWKECSVAEAPYNKIQNLGNITRLNIYYNGMSANKTVETRIERIEAVCERNGSEEIVLLEDFQDSRSVWWTRNTNVLRAEAAVRFGLGGSAFGILLGNAKRFREIMPEFEVAAGLPSPRFDGIWNKVSPDVRRSYFFLTSFDVSEFDDALAIAQRGGFDRILILQNSWTRATGHYEVNTKSFPDGLPQLADTVKRFQDAGFKTGFHFLVASIYPPDSYLTPVPDERFVYGVEAKLAATIPIDATFLPTDVVPDAFPKEDGGYTGHGSVLRVGDELITYTKLKTDAPFGFEGCRRGHLGTKAAEHPRDARIRHLTRAYGYHRIDLDTDLLREVAAHFAKIADACNIDMMYFDGSEWLQGEHWYYNAKLQKAFYDAVKNKNMLMQGSSYSPYSWHQLARAASADGHGDLKGYLDQRSPGIAAGITHNAMPQDIGWYYAYDVNSTIDMYEYILLATLAYDSSMSLQVSVKAAHKHPFTGELLDKIHQFEQLRLSGRITPELREKIKIDPKLGGKKPEEIAESFAHLRKEYRLLGKSGKERLQRVVYTPWQKISPADDAAWDVEIPENLGAVRVGFNVHLLPDAKEKTLTDPFVEIDGKRIAVKGTLSAGQYVFQWPGEATRLYGPPLKDVSQLPTADGELKELSSGRYRVRFNAAELLPCRVRLTLQPAESLAIP